MELEAAPLLIILLLALAAFLAGTIDSIAGGGGLISLPALLLTGMSPQLAVGTNKFSAAVGCSLSVYLFGKAKLIDWKLAFKGIAFSLFGAFLGAKAALALPPDTLGKAFTIMLPLIAIVCLRPQKKNLEAEQVPDFSMPKVIAICFSIGMYDGFFGPGTGTFMILGLFRVLKMDLVKASGTAKVFNLTSNISGLVTFMFSGYVLYSIAIPMAVASIAGNYVGTRLAITKGAGFIRRILPISLAALFITLFMQYFFN